MPHAPGGWSLVVRYLRDRKYLQALQLNRFVVIQIDSDIAGELGVSRPAAASDAQIVELIIAKLCSEIAAEDLAGVRDRLLFAIGVDEIECWLLPAVFDRSDKRMLSKATGCLEAINRKLRKDNQVLLSSGEHKDPQRYRRLSEKYRRRRDVEAAATNAGFIRFLEQLEAQPLDPVPAATP
jgi:hypothetical protein